MGGYATPMSDKINLLLENQLCFALYGVMQAMTAVYRKELESLGLTYTQYLVMLSLWQRDNQSVGCISRELNLDSGTLTPLLKRLQQQGLVKRSRNAVLDERIVNVSLTPRGRQLRERAVAVPPRVAAKTGLSEQQIVSLRRRLLSLTKSLLEPELGDARA